MQIGQLAPRGHFGHCHRLRTRADFTQVFRGGRRMRGQHFAIVVRLRMGEERGGQDPDPAAGRSGSPGSRLGLAVGRKSGNAPQRARLRRLLREAFRSLRYDLTQPIEIVVRTLGPWPGADLAAVHSELGALLVQLNDRGRSGRRQHRSKIRSGSTDGKTRDPAPPPRRVDV